MPHQMNALRRAARIAALAALIGALLACAAPGVATPQPTPTLTVTVTLTPVPSQPTGTDLPEPTVTALPSLTPGGSQPTATGSPAPQPTSAGVTEVQIFLVAIGDNGASGPVIGCGDSIVGVTRQIAPTRGPLRAALTELLSIHDQFYGQSGLYNALYQSSLTLEDVTIDANGTAIIELSGAMTLGGECDDPRVEAQLDYTARQFSTVKDVAITINGTPLEDLLGGQ